MFSTFSNMIKMKKSIGHEMKILTENILKSDLNKSKNFLIQIDFNPNITSIVMRINLFYVNCWIMSHKLKSENFIQRKLSNYWIKQNILRLNKEKFCLIFNSNDKNKLIAEELNRSYRVIFFSLDDYSRSNFMQKELIDIIKE